METFQAAASYRPLLERHALATVAALVRLPSVLVGCHPGRRVAKVTLGHGGDAIPAFLKHERRVSWRERWRNAWAGFGLVSRSVREAKLLAALREHGIGVPEVIAVGDSPAQGAFLLLRELTGWIDLRTFLLRQAGKVALKQQFAQQLGEALARIHAAGFDHPDLYSKHVLVHPGTGAICILDWQRSCRRRRISIGRRCRDLAALDATLGPDLASRSLRLRCLHAYLRASALPVDRWQRYAQRITTRTGRLLQKRRIRELRQPPLEAGAQDLTPLDHGSVFVAPELHDEMTPEFRALLSYGCFPPGELNCLEQRELELPGGRRVRLTHRRAHRPAGWFWAWLRGRTLFSPERHQADLLFRLQRCGIPAPRLLAYGQRQGPPWRQESLLLFELPGPALALRDWLRRCQAPARRHEILGETGRLLRRLHDAAYGLGTTVGVDECFLVHQGDEQDACVQVGCVSHLVQCPFPGASNSLQELKTLGERVAALGGSPSDLRSVLGGYAGKDGLPPQAELWIHGLLRHASEQRVKRAGVVDSAAEPEAAPAWATTDCGAEA